MNTKASVVFSLEDLEVEAPAGTSLSKIVEKSSADVTFGCKSGTCGTCRIRVIEGADNLSTPSSEESDFLRKLRCPSNERLACQCHVNGNVVIEYIGA